MARLSNLRLGSWVAAAAVLGAALPGVARAQTSVEQVSAGITIPEPLGSANDVLTRPVSFAGQVWVLSPSILPEGLQFNAALEYMPLQLRNAAADTNLQLNLNMISAFVGATAWGGPSAWGIRPYISADIGLMYDFLTIPGATGTISNTGTAFALRAAPGVDIPVYSHVGIVVELPISVAFFHTPLGIWESTFALRWKL